MEYFKEYLYAQILIVMYLIIGDQDFLLLFAENPYPTLGNIINIHLSETEDSIQQPNGTFRPMYVDTYFQMNFLTGKWQQLKKRRELKS